MIRPKFWTENCVPTSSLIYVFPLSRLFSADNWPSVVSFPMWRPVPSSTMTTGAFGSTVVPSSIGVSLSPSVSGAGPKVTLPSLFSSPTWADPSPVPTTLRLAPSTLLRTAITVGLVVGLTSESVPAVVLTTPWAPWISPLVVVDGTFSALVSILATGSPVFVSTITATTALGTSVSVEGEVNVVVPSLWSSSTLTEPYSVPTTLRSEPLTFVRVAMWVSVFATGAKILVVPAEVETSWTGVDEVSVCFLCDHQERFWSSICLRIAGWCILR